VQRVEDPIAHFWTKVNKFGPVPKHCPELGNCWLWTDSCMSGGYGAFGVYGKMYKAHRFAYKITYGDPSELCVLHKCDVRSCVRPSHLFSGSVIDNIADMVGKGRQAGPPQKLTDKQKVKILELFIDKQRSSAQIAVLLAISRGLVRKTLRQHGITTDQLRSRAAIGSNGSNAKLTEDKISVIKKQLPFKTMKLLAAEHNVSVSTIQAIAYGRLWKHVK
jgi:DNA-binding CsgD family transcriptional regulator